MTQKFKILILVLFSQKIKFFKTNKIDSRVQLLTDTGPA